MALLPSSWIKYFLTPLGAFLPARAIYSLNASIGYLELGRWMRAKGYDTIRRFSRREELFDLVGQQVRDREVLYLEVDVFQGKATRHWSKLLLNSKSKLHGFDIFEGLPENWRTGSPIVRKAISPHTEKFRRSTTTELLFSRDGSTRLYERINVRQSAP
jgi:hypothetical protein